MEKLRIQQVVVTDRGAQVYGSHALQPPDWPDEERRPGIGSDCNQ